MKKYKSVRNGQIAELVIENEQQVTIRLEESREERNISPATLKRWWKPYEEESTTEEPQTEKEEVIQDEPAEEVNVIDITNDEEPAQIDFSEFQEQKEAKVQDEKPTAKVKSKSYTKDEKEIENDLKEFIIEEAAKRNCTIFSGKVKALVSIKHDKVTAMAFTFGKKGVNLWLREVNCDGITNEYNKTNHLFGARIKLTELTEESKQLIIKLMEKSINFILDKKEKN